MPKQKRQYEQLTREERYTIQALNGKGFSQQAIADSVRKHKSTISRELNRNSGIDGYEAERAQRLMRQRQTAVPRHGKRRVHHENIIHKGLLLGWSPENISLRMKLEMPADRLSHVSIYRYIREDKEMGGHWYTELPRHGKTRYKGGKRKAGRSVIPGRVDISERPAIIEERTRIGDWEGDTVHGQDATLVTLVERKSRLTLIGKTANKTAEVVAAKMSELLKKMDKVYTITLDNGGEFADHAKVAEAVNVNIYFAKPYASYQRGTNENTNGLIRRNWPKGMKLGHLTESNLREQEMLINAMPRKVLSGLTPLEVYTGKRVALIS